MQVQKGHFDWWSFGAWWWHFWKEGIKYDLLEKTPPKLAKRFERYGLLKFKNSWDWIDHIFSTIHEKFMILDFLEMEEQDLQLSCWTKFHLKLSWWCNLELKLVQNRSIFGKFKLQVTCYFWKVLIWLQILQCWCLKCQMRLVWTWMKYL